MNRKQTLVTPEKIEQVRLRFEASERRKKLEQIDSLKQERTKMMRRYLGYANNEFNLDWVTRRWAVDRRYMTLQEFVDYIWPDDCAEKTLFILQQKDIL